MYDYPYGLWRAENWVMGLWLNASGVQQLRGYSPSACRAPLWSDPVGARRRRAKKTPSAAARSRLQFVHLSALL